MGNQLGEEQRLYYDSAANFNSAASGWSHETDLGDVTFNYGKRRVEVPNRGTVVKTRLGRQEWNLSFELNVNPGGTFHDAVVGHIANGVRIHLAVADGNTSTNGTTYRHAWFLLTGELSLPVDDNATISGEGTVDASSTDEPETVTVGA